VHLLQQQELKRDGVARLLVDTLHRALYVLEDDEKHKAAAKFRLQEDYKEGWAAHQPEMVGSVVTTQDQAISVSIGRSSLELGGVDHTHAQLRTAQELIGAMVGRIYPGRKIRYEVKGL
jgi:hypothetical protein|tara:strand:- start:624 stop:980 length:357 start_codon:yes stop_codon:yes gene_type:complete